MGSTNEDGGTNFRWTDEHEKIICELCIKFIRKNGRVSFKWIEINQEFEAIIKRKIHQKALKNKYDAMKRDWRSWKSLKFGETGLGWDPLTGKLSCSDEWWERKIKEKPEVKKFRNKPVDTSLEELWNQLFEDNYANGENVVAPSMDNHNVEPVEPVNVNVEEGNKENGTEDNRPFGRDGDFVYSEYNRYSSNVNNLLSQESTFFTDFVDEFGNTQVPTQGFGGSQVPNQGLGGSQVPNQGFGSAQATSQGLGGAQTPNQGNGTAQSQKTADKTKLGKRKRRQSGGAAKLSTQIDTLVSNSSSALEIMQSDGSASKTGSTCSTIVNAMTVINDMGAEYDLEKGSELWCFAISLIENEVRREIFLNMEDAASRKAWLMYMHSKER